MEHPFLYVKRHFGYAKVRYRGLAKNTQRLMLLFGLTNLIPNRCNYTVNSSFPRRRNPIPGRWTSAYAEWR